MGTQLSESGYKELIEEDLTALEKCMKDVKGVKLEYEHIVIILKDSINQYYGRKELTK